MSSGAGSLLRPDRRSSGFTSGPSRPGPRRGWLRSTQRSRARTSWRSASRSALPSDDRSPLVLRRLLTSPRRAAPSRAPPSRPTRRTRHAWTGILGHPWRSPQVRPATFIAHPPRLRNGPLMDIGLRHAEPARPDRHASYAQPAARSTASHVFLGSRLRLRLPSHPASRTTQLPLTCGWCHQPPQGTRTPELLVMLGALGWPGASQPPAPSDPGVTVSRHRALLISRSTCGPCASG